MTRGAPALWRRFLDRFPDHAEAPRARLRMGQSLAAAGRSAEAAAAFRELWLSAPVHAVGRRGGARASRPGGAGRSRPRGRRRVQRIERAERVAAAGVGDQARAEAEAVLAEGPPVELALKALRVVVDGARRSGRDDAALAATNRGARAVAGRQARARGSSSPPRSSRRRTARARSPPLDRLVADYPKSPEADDALLLKARILESGPDPKSAEPVYLKLAQGYPESEEGLRARVAARLAVVASLRLSPRRLSAGPASRRSATASQDYRDASLYWTARAQTAAGHTESAAKHYAQLICRVAA